MGSVLGLINFFFFVILRTDRFLNNSVQLTVFFFAFTLFVSYRQFFFLVNILLYVYRHLDTCYIELLQNLVG